MCARHAPTRQVAQAGLAEGRQERAATAVHNEHGLAKQRPDRSEGDQPRHATKARTASYVCARLRAGREGLGRTVAGAAAGPTDFVGARAKQGRPQRQLVRGAGRVGQRGGELLEGIPTAAELAQIQCKPAGAVSGANGRCRHALQQRMVLIDRGVAAHAYPFKCPTPGLSRVHGCPMHVTVRQFLPRSL